jgi:hypothetical protein
MNLLHWAPISFMLYNLEYSLPVNGFIPAALVVLTLLLFVAQGLLL